MKDLKDLRVWLKSHQPTIDICRRQKVFRKRNYLA